MAGYSGTPLPKKLGIKDGFRLALLRLPANVEAELKRAIAACEVTDTEPFDFVFLFVKTQAELKKDFVRMAKQLTPAGMLWVAWPKKTSGVATNLTENEVRRIGLEAGLVDGKVCAVDEVWSGLKFANRLKDRTS